MPIGNDKSVGKCLQLPKLRKRTRKMYCWDSSMALSQAPVSLTCSLERVFLCLFATSLPYNEFGWWGILQSLYLYIFHMSQAFSCVCFTAQKLVVT